MTDSLPARPPLDPDRLAALAPAWLVEVLPETPSTNAVLVERARAGAPSGTVITTEHQYAGRGRLDRVWETPARSAIAVSVLLRPDLPAALWPWLPLVTGIAVARTVEGRVKWPNDVLLDDRKVCGILVERIDPSTSSGTGPSVGPAAVIGIGLNVSMTPDELPVPTATSLFIERGEEPDRTALLASLLDALGEEVARLSRAPEESLAAYGELSATIGRHVRVELPSGDTLEGTATAIEPDGRLVVTTDGPDGGPHAVAAGDVVHARLA